MLGVQILTGVFLAIHQTPEVSIAFDSVEHLIRDVESGWLVRQIHANGASFMFIVVQVHIARGMQQGRQMKGRSMVWARGVTLFIYIIGTGFLGQVLPQGQIRMWGATVITNLVRVIPLVGDSVVTIVWGGQSVDNPTLNRFFRLHQLLPFVLGGLALVHLGYVHEEGRNNPLGVRTRVGKTSFQPQFQVKDYVGVLWYLYAQFTVVQFQPNRLGHPDNQIPANAIVTPEHIVPEWQFLRFQAMLRSIPNKRGGVVAMGMALVRLQTIRIINRREVRRTQQRRIWKRLQWLQVVDVVILSWVGQKEVARPQIEVGQIGTVQQFWWLQVGVGIVGRWERQRRRIYKS